MRNFLCTFSATTKANTIRDIYLYGNSRNHLLRCGINIPVDEITLNCPSTVQNGCRFEKSHHQDIYSLLSKEFYRGHVFSLLVLEIEEIRKDGKGEIQTCSGYEIFLARKFRPGRESNPPPRGQEASVFNT
uniref:Uncharacterized protein n=1 Tax=Cacopsylla melanoneura TaxID=428564 RepID=A0A8D9B9H6_9HEMI